MYTLKNKPLTIAGETPGVYPATKRILFVDPDQPSFYLVSELLDQYNVEIIHVINGFQAMVELREHHYDAVVTEIVYIGIDYLNLLNKVQEIQPGIPVIAQTAFLHENMEKSCRLAGFHDFVSKPLPFDKFLAIIHKHVVMPGER